MRPATFAASAELKGRQPSGLLPPPAGVDQSPISTTVPLATCVAQSLASAREAGYVCEDPAIVTVKASVICPLSSLAATESALVATPGEPVIS